MARGKKSKAPKGRAAAKQKAKKSSGNSWSSPHARLSGRQSGWSDDDDDPAPSFRGFAQTNHSTPSRSNFFQRDSSAVKLRHQAISFVSAGSTTPQEFQPKQQEAVGAREESEGEFDDGFVYEEEEDDEEEDDLDDAIVTNIVFNQEVEVSETAMADMHIDSPRERDLQATRREIRADGMNGTEDQAEQRSVDQSFVVDTVGDAGLANGFKASGKQPVQLDLGAEDSDSSEEVVVFSGRNRSMKPTRFVEPSARVVEKSVASPKRKSSPLPPHQRVLQQDAASSQLSRSTTPLRQPASQTDHVTDDLMAALAQQPNGSSHNDENSGTSTPAQNEKDLEAKGWAAKAPKWDAELNSNPTWAPAASGSWWRKGRKRPDLDLPAAEVTGIEGSPRNQPKVAFADPKAEDTIAALQADWRAVNKENKLAKKALVRQDDFMSLDAKSSGSKRRGKRGRRNDNRQLRQAFVEDEDDDEDEEAAYDDYMANLAAQLGGADGSGSAHVAFGQSSLAGPSLVIDGEEIADDEVLKSHFEMMNEGDGGSSSASDEIIGQDLSELSTSDLEDELEYTEREQWEDEEDLRQRRRDQMTDEQIARMFAKQQEFGYHGDDLIIENGQHGSNDELDGIGDVESARAGLANISNFSHGQSSSKRGPRRSGGRGAKNGIFPDASALADSVDQYGENGFDIMDFDRPSLRPTKKGRKGQLPPEVEALSDDELRENIRETWSNDRQKKALKKAEREEQRMEGLLTNSGKKGKPDLSVKYAFGISMEQVHTELRTFMLDDNQTSRGFPPMDKKDRKALHEVANVLNLKSKSVGSGNDRFPTLLKTAKTPRDPIRIDRAINLSINGLLSRDKKLGNKMARKNARATARVSERGGAAAATVRNGEVVGAGAAEIGAGSFGHKMMLKMGWSKGMALGKEGEGRLLPVEQVVRLGTAGLG